MCVESELFIIFYFESDAGFIPLCHALYRQVSFHSNYVTDFGEFPLDSFCLDQRFIQSAFRCFFVIIVMGLIFNPFRMLRNPSYRLLPMMMTKAYLRSAALQQQSMLPVTPWWEQNDLQKKTFLCSRM